MNKKISSIIGKVRLGAKRNAPELLLGGALVTGTATVILASRATLRAAELHKKFKEEQLDKAYLFENAEITDDEFKKEVRKTYSKYALSLVKEYSIPTALYAATVAMVFKSYKVQKNRQLALSAALTACTTAYSTLVSKLRKGAAAGLTAKEILDGVEANEVIDPETGEVTYEKTQGTPIEGLYEIRFDRYSPCWEKDKFQNESTLRSEENWANDKLRLQGCVFLNEVYDRLGLPRTEMGQIVGWTIDGDGDGYIDFGVKDCAEYEDFRFDANAFDLNFNVDGEILYKLRKK